MSLKQKSKHKKNQHKHLINKHIHIIKQISTQIHFILSKLLLKKINHNAKYSQSKLRMIFFMNLFAIIF